MPKIFRTFAGVLALSLSAALPAAPASTSHPVASSRVIVSSTLNGTLHVFDAATLAETQPPLPSKGTSPVRLWVQTFGGRTFLLSANHGIQGSLGVFDLDGPLVTELPLSPFPSGGQGSVGVTAGLWQGETPMIFLTDTVQALGGCGLPHGSLTGYDASLLATAGIARRFGTTSTLGTIPYAVAFDQARGRAIVSNNCNRSMQQFTVIEPLDPDDPTGDYFLENTGIAATGAGPDAVLYDAAFDRTYVTLIGGNGVDVFDSDWAVPEAPATTVPLPGAGPIDATLADSPSGARWMITSNGRDDTVSLLDRSTLDACAAAAAASCNAQVARIFAGVAGGAPEGVAYDPATNRIFVVNKTIGAPALSVVQLHESGGTVTGTHIATIPLKLAGSGTPIPDLIAFDVVVQQR